MSWPLWHDKSRRRQGLVDPRRRPQGRRERHPVREALRVGRVRGAQDLGALLLLGLGQTVVDVVGRHEAKGAVAMLEVVPGEEPPAERLGILVGSEPRREVRRVLNCASEKRTGAPPSRSPPTGLSRHTLAHGWQRGKTLEEDGQFLPSSKSDTVSLFVRLQDCSTTGMLPPSCHPLLNELLFRSPARHNIHSTSKISL